MERIRGLSLYRSPVHGGGSRTVSFETRQEAVDWVHSPMIKGEYERMAQVAGKKWQIVDRRKRSK